MARKSKIDWGKARQEFIATKELTLKMIAGSYGVSYTQVRNVASREKWINEKEQMWGKAEEEALIETEGSIKDLIKRHSKVARYLQAGGLKNLKLILDQVEEELKTGDVDEARKILKQLIFNKIITPGTLTTMIVEGLKAERELYPKQMQIQADLTVASEGLSKEAEEAIYESFRRKIGRKQPSIHRVRKSKTDAKKK